MPRGGARAGAGRKSNAEREAIKNASSERLQKFAERSLADLEAFYEANRDLALGIYFEGCEVCAKELARCRCKEGPSAVRIYRQPPDQRALAVAIEHAKGRAAQAAQVQQETQITVTLGCRKCGGYDPVIPRPKVKGAESGGGGDLGRDDGGPAGGGGMPGAHPVDGAGAAPAAGL